MKTLAQALWRISNNKSTTSRYQLGSLSQQELLQLIKIQAPSVNENFEDMFGHTITLHELDTFLCQYTKVN